MQCRPRSGERRKQAIDTVYTKRFEKPRLKTNATLLQTSRNAGKSASHFGLPSPAHCSAKVCKELQREIRYDKNALARHVATLSICSWQVKRPHATTLCRPKRWSAIQQLHYFSWWNWQNICAKSHTVKNSTFWNIHCRFFIQHCCHSNTRWTNCTFDLQAGMNLSCDE